VQSAAKERQVTRQKNGHVGGEKGGGHRGRLELLFPSASPRIHSDHGQADLP
jgi:hypothetical protein